MTGTGSVGPPSRVTAGTPSHGPQSRSGWTRTRKPQPQAQAQPPASQLSHGRAAGPGRAGPARGPTAAGAARATVTGSFRQPVLRLQVKVTVSAVGSRRRAEPSLFCRARRKIRLGIESVTDSSLQNFQVQVPPGWHLRQSPHLTVGPPERYISVRLVTPYTLAKLIAAR